MFGLGRDRGRLGRVAVFSPPHRRTGRRHPLRAANRRCGNPSAVGNLPRLCRPKHLRLQRRRPHAAHRPVFHQPRHLPRPPHRALSAVPRPRQSHAGPEQPRRRSRGLRLRPPASFRRPLGERAAGRHVYARAGTLRARDPLRSLRHVSDRAVAAHFLARPRSVVKGNRRPRGLVLVRLRPRHALVGASAHRAVAHSGIRRHPVGAAHVRCVRLADSAEALARRRRGLRPAHGVSLLFGAFARAGLFARRNGRHGAFDHRQPPRRLAGLAPSVRLRQGSSAKSPARLQPLGVAGGRLRVPLARRTGRLGLQALHGRLSAPPPTRARRHALALAPYAAARSGHDQRLADAPVLSDLERSRRRERRAFFRSTAPRAPAGGALLGRGTRGGRDLERRRSRSLSPTRFRNARQRRHDQPDTGAGQSQRGALVLPAVWTLPVAFLPRPDGPGVRTAARGCEFHADPHQLPKNPALRRARLSGSGVAGDSG